MTRLNAAPVIFALLAWPLAATAQAVDIEQWNSTRADLFSKVCMGSAPSFSAFEANAVAAGFTAAQDRLVVEPDVTVELLSDIGLCRCLMMMGAPDPTALADEIVATLQSDFPGSWGPDTGQKELGSKAFFLDGVPIHLGIVPTSLEQQPGIVASARVKGDCPA